MPKQRLTDRQLISGVTLTDLLHFVVTGDTSQNPAGSSYKGNVEQLFGAFSAYTCSNPLTVDVVNACTSGITINGNVVINGSATTINTEVIQSKDNNIVLNYSGTHLTAIGGGITLEDGVSDGVDSKIFTNSDGVWLFDPGLSASTGTIDTLSACTGVYTSNIYGCSPITVNDSLVMVSGKTITSSTGGGQINITDSIIDITTDNAVYSTPYLYLDPTYGYLHAGNPSGSNGGGGIYYYNPEASAIFTSAYDGGSYVSGLGLLSDSGLTIDTITQNGDITLTNILIANNTSIDQLSTTQTNPSIFIGTQSSVMSSGVTNSVILGGSGITGNTNDTVYVDNLNINTIGSGTSVINLGLDSSGNVVTGNTSQKYAADIPFTAATSQTVTHNLNDTDVIVQLKDSTGTLVIPNVVDNYTNNTVDIEVSSTETFRVIIIG